MQSASTSPIPWNGTLRWESCKRFIKRLQSSFPGWEKRGGGSKEALRGLKDMAREVKSLDPGGEGSKVA
jgi:hypothetical protein